MSIKSQSTNKLLVYGYSSQLEAENEFGEFLHMQFVIFKVSTTGYTEGGGGHEYGYCFFLELFIINLVATQNEIIASAN